MVITASDVKVLRDKTGAGMLLCKKALEEVNGDFEKAIEYLRKHGEMVAQKRADRVAREGKIYAKVIPGKAVLLEINCETDFVSRNSDFIQFVQNIAQHLLGTKADNVEDLLEQNFFQNPRLKIKEVLAELTGKIGENIQIRRFNLIYFSSPSAYISSYVHSNEKLGVLVKFSSPQPGLFVKSEFVTFANDMALQVTAAAPSFIERKDVPETVLAQEKEIYRAQLTGQNKPEKVIENIVRGKLEKFYEDHCLVNQLFIKDDKKTVGQLLQNLQQTIMTEFKIEQFVRYVLGN